MRLIKFHLSVLIIVGTCICAFLAQLTNQNAVLDNVSDVKGLKKLFRTKNNMLLMFVSNLKLAQSSFKVFRETAEVIKGIGTMLLIDCSNSSKKKICKKLKVSPDPFVLKHYKDGEFHKDYDRQMTVTSMVNFMRNPSGDLPWEEDPIGINVYHIHDSQSLIKFLKKEAKALIMFYAPWCGYCKQMKPEYSAAAMELKGKYSLAAIDVDRPENTAARRLFNITGITAVVKI